MSAFQFNDLLNQLEKPEVTAEPIGVSFRGRNFKLNSEEDCQEVIRAIDATPDMTFLDLEGNTLGVAAAKAIGESLKTRKHLSRALWKDMFTGRMKTEIPQALEFLTTGLQVAGARLTELDLSDNAFGPIGVQALAAFLQSEVCYGLQVLRLNNNGLGIGGGKILAGALKKAFENSSSVGKPFALKTFIAGRNRLENDGATVLANVFKALGSLEEISMPQNGIYHKGISKLSEALMSNTNLRLLNLNDNTLTAKGAKSLAAALPALQKLQVLNLGDCLLKTKGAVILADALCEKHFELEEVIMDSNEIRTEGGLAIVRAVKNKGNLRTLCLLGNEFGEKGKSLLKSEAEKFNIGDALDWSGDDDEGDASDDEPEEEESDDYSSSQGSGDESSDSEEDEQLTVVPDAIAPKLSVDKCIDNPAIQSFLTNPSPSNLELVDKDDVVKTLQTIEQVPAFIKLIMKVSDVSHRESETIKNKSKALAFKLYKALFNWAENKNQLSSVNNELFVYLQLIKGEDEEFKINWDAEKCVRVLEEAVVEKIVPDSTQHILTCCLEQKIKNSEEIIIT